MIDFGEGVFASVGPTLLSYRPGSTSGALNRRATSRRDSQLSWVHGRPLWKHAPVFDSGDSHRPRSSGRPDATFQLMNAVSFRHGDRFRSSILTACFLTVYASTPASRPANGNTHFSPARYGFGEGGLSPPGSRQKVSLSRLQFLLLRASPSAIMMALTRKHATNAPQAALKPTPDTTPQRAA